MEFIYWFASRVFIFYSDLDHSLRSFDSLMLEVVQCERTYLCNVRERSTLWGRKTFMFIELLCYV